MNTSINLGQKEVERIIFAISPIEFERDRKMRAGPQAGTSQLLPESCMKINEKFE